VGDLRPVLGVCRVVRVAAADAEKLRQTPFQMETKFLVRFCAFRCGFGGSRMVFCLLRFPVRELCGESASGKFGKLLRSDPGPLGVWVVPGVSVV
jgi:hypothetical protein